MPEGFRDLLGQNIRHLWLIVPEVLVVFGFLVALVYDLILPEERRRTTGYICLIFIVGALWASVVEMGTYVNDAKHAYMEERVVPAGPDAGAETRTVKVKREHEVLQSKPIFSGMVHHDAFGNFFRMVLLLGTAITLLVSMHAKELFGKNHGEFFLLVSATCLGGMFLSAASNLLMIYLSLEALSVISYAMAGYLRQNRKSAEAGMKYVIYGAMASGIMIFGMSYLYGITGTLDLAEVAKKFQGLEDSLASKASRGALVAVLAMVFAGLLYKIAAAPFHYWSPDVYEGAPTTATGFFSVVPKAAGFAVLVRVVAEFFPIGAGGNWDYHKLEKVFAALALLTMFIGNLAALGQSNAKRMLAYSSIAHAGYMLAGLSVLRDSSGPAAVLYYLVVYLFMNLGAFMVLVAMENVHGSCELKDLRGAARQQPLLGVALVIFLFSLTGLPPLAGFIGKYLIMVELAKEQSWSMVVFIGLNSVISLYYYMRLAKTVAIDAPTAEVGVAEPTPAIYRALAVGQVVALLLLFVYFEPIQRLCQQVVEPLR